jgi:hypothetical protein
MIYLFRDYLFHGAVGIVERKLYSVISYDNCLLLNCKGLKCKPVGLSYSVVPELVHEE